MCVSYTGYFAHGNSKDETNGRIIRIYIVKKLKEICPTNGHELPNFYSQKLISDR